MIRLTLQLSFRLYKSVLSQVPLELLSRYDFKILLSLIIIQGDLSNMEMCLPSILIFYIYICSLRLFQFDISPLFLGIFSEKDSEISEKYYGCKVWKRALV